jgi:P27 family predicted phage terminase small subunit
MADPLVGSPEKPDWLDAVASEAWDTLEGLLTERRVLSRADGAALELLCSTYSGWRSAAAALAKDGPAVETSIGGFKPSPELQAVDRLGRLLLSLLREFGLTPSSRAGVGPIVDLARDDLGVFLAKGRVS